MNQPLGDVRQGREEILNGMLKAAFPDEPSMLEKTFEEKEGIVKALVKEVNDDCMANPSVENIKVQMKMLEVVNLMGWK